MRLPWFMSPAYAREQEEAWEELRREFAGKRFRAAMSPRQLLREMNTLNDELQALRRDREIDSSKR